MFVRFIGVLVYSAPWNHYWQFNKTLALILSYIYSCINPFALYFLSTTFRHFYKRYLFFWTNTSCCAKGHLTHQTRRHRAGDLLTMSEYQRNSSVNNVSTYYYDLNRAKNSSFHQTQQSSIKMHRYAPTEVTADENRIKTTECAYTAV